MRTSTKSEIEAANAYEDLLVASLFGEWAAHVSDAANIGPEHSVLDVACGTGVLAREIHRRVGSHGSVTGLDPAPGMLTVATRLDPDIEWRQGTAEELPFEGSSFDRVVSQFGLMFFRDRSKALSEMLRVVKPGGTVVVAVWDEIENSPAYDESASLLEERAGTEAADCVRAPFSLGDAKLVQALVRELGVEDVKQATLKGRAKFPNLRIMMEADLRGWLPLLGVNLDESLINAILAEAETRLAQFVAPDGRLIFDTSAHLFTVKQ